MSAELIAFSGSTANAPAAFLGEGPTYDPHTDTAWWFDIIGQKLFEYPLAGGTAKIHDLPAMSSVLARIDGARQLVVTETGLHVRDVATGALDLVTPIEADNPITRSNDGRVHPCGALWFGTMGKKAEKKAGAIYHVARGVVTLLYPEITIPNAICFSPDDATAYFTDTMAGRMMRVAIDPATALPVGEPTVFVDNRGNKGGLDGAVCGRDGVVWNARWGAACIDAYAPDGTHLKSLATPASQTSCPAFIGARADRLLATSAQQDLSPGELAADQEAGKTFLLDYPVKGRFEPDYIL